MTPQDQSAQVYEFATQAPVIPVIVVDDPDAAVRLQDALVQGGLPMLEVTLRTSCALECIAAMAKATVHGIVGAGTVLSAQDVKAAKDAGARFAVSPGATPSLIAACIEADLPLMPGAASASEAMALLEQGYTLQKFFPAMAAGGPGFLKSLSGPLPQISFCPTGGVTPENAMEFLTCPNVPVVGGSWVAPRGLMQAGKWQEIAEIAHAASQLGRGG